MRSMFININEFRINHPPELLSDTTNCCCSQLFSQNYVIFFFLSHRLLIAVLPFQERCVDNCAGKLIRSNHRLMGTYVQLMPRMVQRRMEEMESKMAENAKAAEAAAAAAGTEEGSGPAVPVIPAVPEGLPAAEVPVTPSPPSEVPSFVSPAVTDVAPVQTFNIPEQAAGADLVSTLSPAIGEARVMPEVPSSVLKPIDYPIELGPAASLPVKEERMTAATPLTPATETGNPSVLTNAVNGPAFTVGPPSELPLIIPEAPLPLFGAHSESVNSVPNSLETLPVLTPARLVTLSEETTVSTIAAPTLSKATERLAEPERAPEVHPESSQ